MSGPMHIAPGSFPPRSNGKGSRSLLRKPKTSQPISTPREVRPKLQPKDVALLQELRFPGEPWSACIRRLIRDAHRVRNILDTLERIEQRLAALEALGFRNVAAAGGQGTRPDDVLSRQVQALASFLGTEGD